MNSYCECPDCEADHGRSFDHPVRCDACCAREMTEEQHERALRPLREALGMPSGPRAELAAAAVSAVRALGHSSAALYRISHALTATGREAAATLGRLEVDRRSNTVRVDVDALAAALRGER